MSLEHYIQIRETLIELADDFISLASTSNFFNHELLYPPEGVGEEPDVWSDEDFELLQRSFDGTSSWQEFILSDDGGQCSRYWSINDHTGHIPLFEQLCERGWQLLLAVSSEGSSQMPPGFCVDGIRPRVGVSGAAEWLALLHETAFRFPTVKLHGECGWRCAGDKHCVSNIIDFDIIRASANLICHIVNADCVIGLGGWDGSLELKIPPHVEDEVVECSSIQSSYPTTEVHTVQEQLCASDSRSIIVDRETFEVGIGLQRCSLGNTVLFQVFERLAQRPNVLVSIRNLQCDVWNDDHIDSNSIKRSVRLLRNKLQKAGVTQVEIDSSTKDHARLKLH